MPKNKTLPPIIKDLGTTKIDAQGYFTVNSSAIFFVTFTDKLGELFDPSSMEITIIDPNGDIAETISNADKIDPGQYAVLWTIPSDASFGKYTLNIDYVAETTTGTQNGNYSEDFVVSEKTGGNYDYVKVAHRKFLESLIGYTQRIPVFHEPARLDNEKKVAKLSFPRWNQSANAEIYVNGNLKETGYDVDWITGRVTFDKTLSQYDQVMVSYNFRWFDDYELDNFIAQGINIYNQWPPFTFYTPFTIPEIYIIGPFYAAAIDVIRRWMMDILYQEPVKIFGSPERAQQVFGNMDTLKKNYEDMLYKILDNKKYGPYPSIGSVTVPEFTLPGGRSRWFRYIFKGN